MKNMISPKALLNIRKIRAKKKWGQHFLTQQSMAEKIVSRSNVSSNDRVLEIGSGLGALTLPLARAAEKVYAIERDAEMVELLKTELLAKKISNVVLLNQDILRIDLFTLLESETEKITVVGNLPYNISSQIIIKLIKSRQVISKAVVMVQKELAKRLTSTPSCKEYGRLTVLINYCSDVKKIAEVEGSSFFPKVAVDSEVLEIVFKDRPDVSVIHEEFLFRVVKAGFSKRRKTLKNALAGSELSLNVEAVVHSLHQAGIDPTRRAETLTTTEFAKLTDALWQRVHL
jgi:16S rRNA (adenine1518-N6/adenine1519-N6)-dimethyltransferase